MPPATVGATSARKRQSLSDQGDSLLSSRGRGACVLDLGTTTGEVAGPLATSGWFRFLALQKRTQSGFIGGFDHLKNPLARFGIGSPPERAAIGEQSTESAQHDKRREDSLEIG